MKKIIFLAAVALLFSSCSFEKEHNKRHQQDFTKGMNEFHELFDYFVMSSR